MISAGRLLLIFLCSGDLVFITVVICAGIVYHMVVFGNCKVDCGLGFVVFEMLSAVAVNDDIVET